MEYKGDLGFCYFNCLSCADLDHSCETVFCAPPTVQFHRFSQEGAHSSFRPIGIDFQIKPTCQPRQQRCRTGTRIKVHCDLILALLHWLPDLLEDQQEAAKKIDLLKNGRQVLLVRTATLRRSQLRRPCLPRRFYESEKRHLLIDRTSQ